MEHPIGWNGITVNSRYLEVGYLDLSDMSNSKSCPQAVPIKYHYNDSLYLEQRYLDFRVISTSFSIPPTSVCYVYLDVRTSLASRSALSQFLCSPPVSKSVRRLIDAGLLRAERA